MAKIRKQLIRPLASVKIAVVVMVGMSVLVAIGTVVESRYNAYAAKKLVYHTWWMFGILILLSVNLTAVMIDRWPWKKRHMPFIFAHIGILVLLLGSLITWIYGLDGIMRIEVGKSSQWVSVDTTELNLFASFDGESYSPMLNDKERIVDFFMDPPSEEKPFFVSNLDAPLMITAYEKYVLPERQVVDPEGEKGIFGAGVRFQIFNNNANEVDWLVQRRQDAPVTKAFGPAFLHLGPVSRQTPVLDSPHNEGLNEAFLTPLESGKLELTVYQSRSQQPIKKTLVQEGDVVDLGWMDLKIRILRYLPLAKETWEVQKREFPTDLTTPAIQVRFRDKNHWVLLNDVTKLFTDNAAYIFSYAQRKIDIGFPVQLQKFEMEKYQGTNRAKSYKSFVVVPELGVREISMNEPLEYKGLTLYQNSFQEDEMGNPTASILSVNYDPGRWLKYLGSLILSIGIVLLFWFKKMMMKSTKESQ